MEFVNFNAPLFFTKIAFSSEDELAYSPLSAEMSSQSTTKFPFSSSAFACKSIEAPLPDCMLVNAKAPAHIIMIIAMIAIKIFLFIYYNNSIPFINLTQTKLSEKLKNIDKNKKL